MRRRCENFLFPRNIRRGLPVFTDYLILFTFALSWIRLPISSFTAIYLRFYLVLRAKKLKKADLLKNIQVWTGLKTKKARKHWVCGLNKIF